MHVLVIPKGEYVSLTDFSQRRRPRLIAGFWRAVTKVAEQLGRRADGYRIGSNDGPGGGQVVFHFHVHILSGTADVIAPPRAARGRGRACRPGRRRAQKYPTGTKQRPVRFARQPAASTLDRHPAAADDAASCRRCRASCWSAGSGPTDRDGNNSAGAGPHRSPEADRRAAGRRTASPRCATTSAASALRRPQPHGTLDEQERFFAWDNFVGDVVAAHAELLRHDEIKPYATALLGHSEGGLLALAAAPAMGKNARPTRWCWPPRPAGR